MKSSWLRFAVPLLAGAALLAGTASAAAAVRHEGDWDDDDDDREITLNFEHVPRAEAVKQLAEAAGWSIVFDNPPLDLVDVHVNEATASQVLDTLLANGNYLARRDGKLISISREAQGAAPPTPPTPPTPAASSDDEGSDRVITGSNFTVQKGETVHDVKVYGGNLDVYGTVTGDVVSTGGNVRIHKGGKVLGDAKAMGGNIDIEDDASIAGDVSALGGSIHRSPRAQVGGDIRENSSKHEHEHATKHERHRSHGHDADVDGMVEEAVDTWRDAPSLTFADKARSAVTVLSLIFVFGAVMLALLAGRMEKLRVQIASAPMRTFALGIVGAIGITAALGALCVTIVGIPFAIALGVVVFFGALAGIVAVLETVGAALLGHRTKNPYVHLAVGCVLLLVLSAIPILHWVVWTFVAFTGLGSFVKTGGAFGKRQLRGGDADADAYA